MRHPSPDRIPARRWLWSLSEDVQVEVGPDGEHLVALTEWGEIEIDDTSPLVRESLHRMSLGPVAVENLPILRESFQLWRDGRTDESQEPWQRLKRVLDQLGGCVVQSLGLDDETGPVLSVAPVSRDAAFWLPPEIDPDRPIRLSRFVAMRASNGELVLESPLTRYRVALHLPLAAWVVGSLASPTTVRGLSELLNVAGPVLADIVAYLVASGIVLVGEPATPARFSEDGDEDMVPWSHHDLVFHAFSRMGRHGGSTGAVRPHLDRTPPPPVTKPRLAGRRFPLFRPLPAELRSIDPPLAAVIESSASSPRDYSDAPLTAEQVGELLFRVARLRWTRSPVTTDRFGRPVPDRSYPNTGGMYELELYLSLDRCRGLPRGSYHYDPREHVLTLINDSDTDLAELLDMAKVAAGSIRRPPVLITFTTRIARLSWMYNGIAYSTTLKHLGALQQTLHLVATAMGLAAYALAVGDGAVADAALRLDWPSEVSIGELLVGTRM